MNPFVLQSTRPADYQSPIIVALDFADELGALAFAARLDPALCAVKVGKELFTASGRTLVEKLVASGFRVFLDLKFHDIPNTVAQACKVAAQMGVWLVDVHASGGRRMMSAAREAIEGYSQRPLLIGVTVLTSMEATDLAETGITIAPQDQVLRLAQLTRDAGLDGVVCSAQEAALLRQHIEQPFCLVTPGIRLTGDDNGDQRRVMTPHAAIAAGADYLVIGRSITRATDPITTLNQILSDTNQ